MTTVKNKKEFASVQGVCLARFQAKDLGLCYFMEFNGDVDAGVRCSFALRESESQLSRFISSQNVFSDSSRSISVKRTTFGVPLGGPKHSV